MTAAFANNTLQIGNLSGTTGTGVRTNFGATAGNRNLEVNQTVDATFAGTLNQADANRRIALTKAGDATLTLTAVSNTYTGPTTINEGTLRIAEEGRLANGNYVGDITNANGAILNFDSTAAQTLTGAITGTGELLKSNTGFLTISGNPGGFTGATNVTGGRLILNGSLGGDVTVGADAAIGGNGTGLGNLITTADAGIVLNGGAITSANTFNGVTLGGTTYLEFASTPVNATVYDVVTYGAGGMSGFSSLTPLARGSLADDSANNKITFTAGAAGTRTWAGGDGVWDRFGTLTNWVEDDQVFFNGDTVAFGNIASDTTITIAGNVIPGGPVVAVSNSSDRYTFAGSGAIIGSAGITMSGTGTLVLATNNSNTGPTTVTGGTLRIGSSEVSVTTFTDTGRTITVNSGATLELSYRNAFGVIPSSPLTSLLVDGGTVTGSTVGTTGSVNVLANPTLRNGATLHANIPFLGWGTFQFVGTVTVDGTSPSFITGGTGSVAVGNGADNSGITTFDVSNVTGDAAADLVVSSSIRNSGNNNARVGGLTKTGDGTMLLTAANIYTGDTTVAAGTLAIIGALGDTTVTVEAGAPFPEAAPSAGTSMSQPAGRFRPATASQASPLVGCQWLPDRFSHSRHRMPEPPGPTCSSPEHSV